MITAELCSTHMPTMWLPLDPLPAFYRLRHHKIDPLNSELCLCPPFPQVSDLFTQSSPSEKELHWSSNKGEEFFELNIMRSPLQRLKLCVRVKSRMIQRSADVQTLLFQYEMIQPPSEEVRRLVEMSLRETLHLTVRCGKAWRFPRRSLNWTSQPVTMTTPNRYSQMRYKC